MHKKSCEPIGLLELDLFWQIGFFMKKACQRNPYGIKM
jgi:hypothetical protein